MRQKWWFIAAFVVPVLVVASVLAGLAVHHHRVTQAKASVRVSWLGDPSCAGTTVRHRDHGVLLIAQRGLRCSIRVEVRNHGRHDVHLSRIGAWYPSAPSERLPEDASFIGLDDSHHLDQDVQAGRGVRYTMHIAFRTNGCATYDELGTSRWPAVDFTVMGSRGKAFATSNLDFVPGKHTRRCAAQG